MLGTNDAVQVGHAVGGIVLRLVDDEQVQVFRRILLEHRDELDPHIHAAFLDLAGGLLEQISPHGNPADFQAALALQPPGAEQAHHRLAASGRAFDQHRTHLAIEKEIPHLLDDPGLVGPGFDRCVGNEFGNAKHGDFPHP